jgi:tellurite resistance protein TehA-like permease
MAVYVCWWVGAVWMVGAVLFVLACLLSTRSKGLSRTGGARFAPLVGFLVALNGVGTVAFVGGLLASLRKAGDGLRGGVGVNGEGEWLFSAGMAAPIVVFSLCATGASWFFSNLDVGVLLHELLLIMGWPPPEHTATTFSMVGPLGQCAAALLILADATERWVGGASLRGGDLPEPGEMTSLAAMPPVEIICVLFGLLLGGMAVLWLLLGIVTVFFRLSQGKLVWNPSWNGIVPPVAALAILSIQLSGKLESSFFLIAACAIIVACVLIGVVNLLFSARLVVTAKSKRDVRATGNMEVV